MQPIEEIQPPKKPMYSRTLWVAFIMAALAFFPSVQAWVSANPEWFQLGVACLFAGLRILTKGKVSIS
jgi:hypothetical protein